MSSVNKFVGNTASIQEGGKGLRFYVKDSSGESIPAFAIRFDGQVYAYLNRCGHIAVQLDYLPGEFFSDDGRTLMCATHGAEYAPDTGACLGGPCYGIGLEPLTVRDQKGQLVLHSTDYEVVDNPS
jgi:nitrite reductase/ring-hydroxylating ferredoxin subunit